MHSNLIPALPFLKHHILDSSKPKEFADDNFKFDENVRKFSKQVENTVGKGEIARYEQFSFSHRVFKILVMETHKKPGFVWERVNNLPMQSSMMGPRTPTLWADSNSKHRNKKGKHVILGH